MSLLDKIAADQEALDKAQAILDAASVKLSLDKAALANIQPHLVLIDQIEADLGKVIDGMDEDTALALVEVKAAILPFLAEMRTILGA